LVPLMLTTGTDDSGKSRVKIGLLFSSNCSGRASVL
jgi:hypothetical protein